VAYVINELGVGSEELGVRSYKHINNQQYIIMKKLFLLLIPAAMMFAFAACEKPTP
jgi:hypothetical protein